MGPSVTCIAGVRAATLGMMLLVAQLALAEAAEIRIIGSSMSRTFIEGVTPKFEAATGHRLKAVFVPSGQVVNRIRDGEAVDVALSTSDGIEALARQGKLIVGSTLSITHAATGAAVRAGAPKPDIGTPARFKRALLAAKSVAYSNPAGGGQSSVELFRALEALGIADEVKAKGKLGGGGKSAGQLVAAGEAEIGIQQVPELLAVSGIELIGALPKEIATVTVLTAGVTVKSTIPEEAKELTTFLRSPAARAVAKAVGMAE
jgi:molybdate transport system substrate-binding protein